MIMLGSVFTHPQAWGHHNRSHHRPSVFIFSPPTGVIMCPFKAGDFRPHVQQPGLTGHAVESILPGTRILFGTGNNFRIMKYEELESN